ncbi:unnamed protein product [Gongylonema pulchrum]|uniref:C-type lectin domain-containing protein n=1 Tax=Gongylonema pulchrum TaxID=637853 RepID=A0A183EFR9_9BILA|nr:unnamed protein product [Gongylonema pulchrum]
MQLKSFWFLEKVYTEGIYGVAFKPYWIGVRKINSAWMMPVQNKPSEYIPVTFTKWGRSQPDGCCLYDVTCVVVNHWNERGEWDDQGCYSHVNNAGAVCQKQSL